MRCRRILASKGSEVWSGFADIVVPVPDERKQLPIEAAGLYLPELSVEVLLRFC